MAQIPQPDSAPPAKGVKYWLKFSTLTFLTVNTLCALLLLTIVQSGRVYELYREQRTKAEHLRLQNEEAAKQQGIRSYFINLPTPAGNAKNIQSKLLQLAALPQGWFSHQQVEQIFAVKLNVQRLPSKLNLYQYESGPLRIALYYDKHAIFVYNWDKNNQGREKTLGNCIETKGFITALQQKGWQQFDPAYDIPDFNVRLYNIKDPRRWIALEDRKLAWHDGMDRPATSTIALPSTQQETYVNCISQVVIYDTK